MDLDTLHLLCEVAERANQAYIDERDPARWEERLDAAQRARGSSERRWRSAGTRWRLASICRAMPKL